MNRTHDPIRLQKYRLTDKGKALRELPPDRRGKTLDSLPVAVTGAVSRR